MPLKNLLTPQNTKSLQKFLRNELPVLQQSPLLLITSEPAAMGAPPLQAVGESSKLLQFTLGQQFGLRTVPSHVSSAFPTLQDMEQRLELLRRTGASSIVAVGSGAAVDLAKALAVEKKDSLEHLILVPSTYASILAAGSTHSLLLDSVEETLVPLPAAGGDMTRSCETTVVLLDSKYIAPVDHSHVVNASLAIILDACLRKSQHPLLNEMLTDMHHLIVEKPDQELSHEMAINLLFQSGDLLSYGLGREDRSAPLALAASLIPRIFPHVHVLSFFGSLLPGLCEAFIESSSEMPLADELCVTLRKGGFTNIPKLAVTDESMQGFSVPDMALSHIQANQTVWKAFDVPNDTLTKILSNSLKTE